MPDKKFDLGDYVEVKDRIAKFYDLYGQGRLVTDTVTLTREPDDRPRVMVRALAYRNPDDIHPAVGTSWMELPGTTPYTKGSEVENAETSAWGRAIAALGILTDKSIASAQEVANKQDERTVDGDGVIHEPDEPRLEIPDAVVKGVVSFGNPPVDGNLRPQPDGGNAFGFRLKPDSDKLIPQVFVTGQLAEDIADATVEVSLDGKSVILHGDIYRVPWKKGGKQMPAFQRLILTRIVTDVWSLPAAAAVSTVDDDELDRLPF